MLRNGGGGHSSALAGEELPLLPFFFFPINKVLENEKSLL